MNNTVLNKLNNKGIATSFLAAFILLIVGFIGIVFVLSTVMRDATDEAEILKCRLSVMQRAMTRNPLTRGGLGELQCNTLRRSIDAESQSKEAVMNELSNQIVGCWDMFGEGALKSLQDAEFDFFKNLAGRLELFGSNDAFCFVCYDVELRSSESFEISEADFLLHFDRTVYRTYSSFDIADTASSRSVGADEETARSLDLERCVRRGGECTTNCNPNSQVRAPNHEDWLCRGSDVCCLERNEVYTYADYLRFHSGMHGSLMTLGEPFSIRGGQQYAIAYVEPKNVREPGFIAIGDFRSIAESGCIQI